MAPSHSGNTSSRPPHDSGEISILHVDDQADFLEMAAHFFKRKHERFAVETATSASEGLTRLSETEVDCIVSDYEMPGMNGLEFLEAVREEHPDLPFILFTGKGSEEVASDAISAGVTDYLQKEAGSDQFTLLANRIENAVHQTRTEHRLEESHRRFRTLLSNVPGMAYRCRNERGWPMLFVSNDCADLMGYEGSELVDGDVSYGRDVIHPDDRDRVWQSVQTALESREPFRVEYRIRTADDGEKWVWEQGQGVFEDGEAVALEGFITDVTERMRSQERLEYQSSLMEAQMETTIDGLLVVDEDRNIVSYNDRFTEMWEIPDEVAETKSDEALLEWVVEHKLADPEEFLELVEELYERPAETSRDEVQLTDGRVFDRYSAPVIGDDGTNYGRLWVFRNITARKERERELEQQEFLFSRVQEVVDVGVWEYNPQTDDISWSDGIRRIHGVDDDYEPTLEEALEFYHPDDRDEITKAVTRAIEDREGYDLELRIVRPDGDVRDVRARGEVGTDEHGETELVRGVFQDITERKERERELQKFKAAVEQAGHAIYITDIDGTIEYVNPAFEEVTGYPAEEAIDETPAILSSGEYDDAFYERLWETIQAGEKWEHEIIDQRKDGTEVVLDQTIAPIEIDSGETDGFVAVNRDITDREERKEQLQIYKYACNSALSGMAIATLDGEVRSVNPAFCDMWGYESEQELVGDSVTAFWERPEDAADAVTTIRETGSWEGELRAVRQDGSTFTAFCSASYVTDDAGEPIALMSSFVDITERKEHEQELANREQRLRTILENVPVILFAIDQNNEITLQVGKGLDQVGLEQNQMVGATVDDAFGDSPAVMEAIERSLDGEPVDVTVDLWGRTYQVWYQPIEDDGQVTSTIGVAMDITDRHKRERGIRALYDATREMMQEPDHERISQIAVDAAQNELNLPLSAIWLQRDDQSRLEPVVRSTQVDNHFDELPVFEPNNSIAWQVFEEAESRVYDDIRDTEARLNPKTEIRSELIVPIGEYGILISGATDTGRFEETDLQLARLLAANTRVALERAEREAALQHQTDQMEFFNSILRHDVLNGMTVIRGRAEFLTEELEGEPLQDAETIVDWSNDIVRIIQRVRTVLETLTGGGDPQLEPIKLSEVLRSEVERVRSTYPEVTFETDIPEGVTVRANELLGEVLGNVITNAVDHNDTEGLCLSVAVEEAANTDDSVLVQIADNGRGVPDDVKEAIFRREQTGHAKSTGSGFGLFFVDSMVTEYGGEVWVEDNDPHGAEFIIQLPTP